MIRKCLCILVTLCLALGVCGCKTPQPESKPEQTHPTMPEFREDLPPAQQLTDAIEKTRAQETYEVCYGTKRLCDEKNEEDSFCQSVTKREPLNWDIMFKDLPILPEKEDFIQIFCGKSLRVIPSNTGLLRFQMSDLEWEEAWPMMYNQEPEGEFEQAICEIAFEVDASGRLSGFEVIMSMEEETLTVFLSIAFPEET